MNLRDILVDLTATPSSYLKAAREISTADLQELRQVNVALLSTFTCELLQPYIVVEAAAQGMITQPYFGPWNQLDQQVFDDASSLYESDPDVVVIAARIEELAPSLTDGFVSLSVTQIDHELENIQQRIRSLLEGLRARTSANILVFNFAPPPILAAGLTDPSLIPSQVSVIQKANDQVSAVCREFSGAYIFDYANTVCEFGIKNWSDTKLWYLARIPFGAKAQIEISKRLARYFRAICYPPCKCLVVDCDDTLWGGILGEEGLGGIHLSEDYPGNVYKDFQRKVLSLKNRGVLLAVASKNNEEDVIEVFEKHTDSVLKPNDFAAIQINWNDKASSLVQIAKDLDIGVDALAFFDDNPVEREWVRSQLPEVTVIDVPESPLEYVRALDESAAFDQLFISEEDRVRPKMYQEQTSRKKLQGRSVSIEAFLKGLEMTATIGKVDANTLPRVEQLLAKTNQFNLTTRRHTSSELQTMIDWGCIALWLRVSDRYGDNGLVGVAIAAPQDADMWMIDSFLMSCRVMGRKVETALLSIMSRFVHEQGGKTLMGEYIPTAKNNMVSEFYSSHSFQPSDGHSGLWKWDLSLNEIPWPEVIQLKVDDETSSS